jgi:hypothetical protein
MFTWKTTTAEVQSFATSLESRGTSDMKEYKAEIEFLFHVRVFISSLNLDCFKNNLVQWRFRSSVQLFIVFY